MTHQPIGTIRLDELQNVVKGLLLAHHAAFRAAPTTPESEAFAKGYQAGLMALAQSAGLLPEVDAFRLLGVTYDRD